MKTLLTAFFKNKFATTAIEYALIAGLISVAIVTGATALGTDLGNTYDSFAEKFDTEEPVK